MHEILQQHRKYDNPPLHANIQWQKTITATHDDIKDEDEDGNDIESLDPCLAANNPQDTEDMATNISACSKK